MSRTMTRPELPLPTVAADRLPLAEELYLLDLVQRYKPTKEHPFMLAEHIDRAMAPHPGATARSECEKFGWLVRAQHTTQVPISARMVSDAGREIAGHRELATADLDKRIRESEDRAKQFKTKEEHTDLPRLRALKAWMEPAKVQAPRAAPKPKAAPKGGGSVLQRAKAAQAAAAGSEPQG